jgi:hypothetical protein
MWSREGDTVPVDSRIVLVFTVHHHNEVGSTVRHAGGQIEAINVVSTQSRAKAIARVHERPGMALRKSWGTSSSLIALFEPREAWVVVRFASWGATTTGGRARKLAETARQPEQR